MDVHASADPLAFRTRVGVWLEADEVRHGLLLGLLASLDTEPGVYPAWRLWEVRAGGRLVLAALRTPPHHLVLATPRASRAVETLADVLAGEADPLPGVVGGLPEAEAFAARYLRARGLGVTGRMEQMIHRLERVVPPPVPAGGPRRATMRDLDLTLEWMRAFSAEAHAGPDGGEDAVRRRVVHRLAPESRAGIWLWEVAGDPVCLVGTAGPTTHTIRIGPVYTPPDRRRRGYAAALVAFVSGEMLARGYRACALYTDLANPTSNALYRRIGYEPVCPSAMIAFGPPTGAG